jgi:CheY-like chemotaxis protein
VLKNLLSNAFKFTERGRVSLKVARAANGWSAEHEVLSRADAVVSFSVTDTGIGIPPEKQKLIFEAFQQADGTTSRKYGGTGLGLSISREIARLLGGEIRLHSEPEAGSTFTFYLPVRRPVSTARALAAGGGVTLASEPAPALAVVEAPAEREMGGDSLDDYETLRPGDRSILIADPDLELAKAMLGHVRKRGLKGLVAVRGDTAVALVRRFKPGAVLLGDRLPDTDSIWVLETLTRDPDTRHIPVHFVTASERAGEQASALGAASVTLKPVVGDSLEKLATRIADQPPRPARRVMIVNDDEAERTQLAGFIESKDLEISVSGTGAEAIEAIRENPVDCLIVKNPLPDISGVDLAREIAKEEKLRDLPVIVVGRKRLTRDQVSKLAKAGKTANLRSARTNEEVREELDALLRPAALADTRTKPGSNGEAVEHDVLAGKRVLVVDDDVRNIFALTSLLERYKMEVRYAENGRAAIETLRGTPDLDIVLMDVMMPEMDGYDTMRAIRADEQFRRLPIVALTARAMRGDREKCIEAGASDYIPKPVVPDQLLSLLKVWFKPA